MFRGIPSNRKIFSLPGPEFNYVKPDRRIYIYIKVGERYAKCNLIKTVSFGSGSIIIWGYISWEGRTIEALNLELFKKKTDECEKTTE